MCGIVGFYRNDTNDQLDHLIDDCLNSISHRGPDHQEYWMDDNVYFGHTRLKILDLSDQANQPFCFQNLVLSFNGEIYNYIELRNQLILNGYTFNTKSDTEVVIKSYHFWGYSCFEKFDGMFAIAIYDTFQRKIILARDIFGKKPLYYSKVNGFAFCSELNAFKILSKNLKLNNEALNHFLGIGYVLEPLTIYENVEALLPSNYLVYELESHKLSQTKYYYYEDCFRNKNLLKSNEIIQQGRFLLNQAIEKRLMGDVSMGVFLSGGIDSSGIVAIIKNLYKDQFPCYTVGFQSSAIYDETDIAKGLTSYLNLEHYKMDLSKLDMNDFENYLNQSDYHTFDNSSYPIFKLAQFAKQNVKYVLTGDGSDEVFGGYSTYIADDFNKKINFLIPFFNTPKLLSIVNQLLHHKNDKVGWKTKGLRFANGMNQDYRLAHYKWREIFNKEERIEILGGDSKELVFDTCPSKQFFKKYDSVKDLDRIDQHLFVDTYTWLSCNNLIKIDRNTMRAGLEARSPFLDKELTAFIASCPIQYKNQKSLLKKILNPVLQANILNRKKTGFNSPVAQWFKTNENEFQFYNQMIFKLMISNNG